MTLRLKNPGSDNQIIASVQGLIEECALVLGRERPVWQEQLAADESPSGLTTMPSHGFLRRRRSRSQADGEAEGQLLIICMREECGGHLRLLQQRLAESLKCEVVIGTDQVDIWRNEVARASRGVVLLQTKTVLRNPVQLLQLFEATRKCRPLVCVNVVGGGYDFEAAKSLLWSLPTPAATQLPDADMKTLRDELSQFGRCNLAELSSGLCHAVPNAISVFFHPEACNTMLEAVVKDVLDKLERERADRITCESDTVIRATQGRWQISTRSGVCRRWPSWQQQKRSRLGSRCRRRQRLAGERAARPAWGSRARS